MSNVAPPCSKWVYYANPVPPWATTRAVQLLAAWNADPSSHAVGDAVYETGGDGRSVRYLYAWHPPDPQNPTPGGHRGVEVQYCVDSAPTPGPPSPSSLWAIEGVDVSDSQGAIDWPTVATVKSFAFIKATEGLPGAFARQASFPANWKGAQLAGVVRGAYHYFRPTQDAVAQAKYHASVVGALSIGDIGCSLDCEHSDEVEPASAYDPSTYGPGVLAYLTTIAKLTGKRPLVYTSMSTWGELVTPADSMRIASVADLWMAAWPSPVPEPGTAPPGTTGAWRAPFFWQYQSGEGGGRCAGISLPVDLDRFAGSLADLARYCAARGPLPVPPRGGGGGAGGFPSATRARVLREQARLSASRRACEELHDFVDALREARGQDPLYCKRVRRDVERFAFLERPDVAGDPA